MSRYTNRLRIISNVCLLAGSSLTFISTPQNAAGQILQGVLPATANASAPRDAGFLFPLANFHTDITVTGSVNLLVGRDWTTKADGSLARPVLNPAYAYANPLASGYPTVDGGDGINEFPGGSPLFPFGGGANYDTKHTISKTGYGFVGTHTTDTTDPTAVRFGEVVGRLRVLGVFGDWFPIGLDTDIIVPPTGAELFLAVNQPLFPGPMFQPTGFYSYTTQLCFGALGDVDPAGLCQVAVPEPNSTTMTICVSFGLGLALRRRLCRC